MPTVPSSPFIEALRAWSKAAAEWLELDPTQVFDFDGQRDERIEEWHITYSSISRQTSKVGACFEQVSGTGDGEVRFDYNLHLLGARAADFDAAVGPKPEQFTPEQQAQLARLAGLRR